MADHHTPVSAEPESIERAEKGWNSFTEFTKYGIYFVVAVLVLMAATLL
jgi:hypothetical protein